MKQAKIRIPPILHTTRAHTDYFFDQLANGRIRYLINGVRKYLPVATLSLAFKDYLAGMQINRNWFKTNFPKEYLHSPCNLKVIQKLIDANKAILA